jgi:methylmalonyl-CoA mutase C-terminal domain/subunit
MSVRPIRVLIAKPGLDGHDVGARLVCRALRDAGMEVIYTGLRQAPETIGHIAADEDVDVVGLSILSGAHLPLCQKVREALSAQEMLGRVLWLVGGNIPRRDHDALAELGVDGVFGTGTPFEAITGFIRDGVRE